MRRDRRIILLGVTLFLGLSLPSSFTFGQSVSKIIALINSGDYLKSSVLLHKSFWKDSTNAGVAFAYSAVMMVWVIPHIIWCVHGTPISPRDILLAVSGPLFSGVLAGGLAFRAGANLRFIRF